MKLSEICVKRPVFTIVVNLILIVLGIIAYSKMQIRNTPNISPPIITVQAKYSGGDALYLEQRVTIPLEKSFKNLKNIDYISSSTSQGGVNITLFFKLDADLEIALNDVRSKISSLSGIFPDDMDLPSASKFDVDNFPSIWISISSDNRDDLELTRIIENDIQSEIEKLPAVGAAVIYGAKYYLMRIEPITHKLYQHKISPMEMERAIRVQNRNYPIGNIETSSTNFSLQLNESLNKVSDFNNIIIKRYSDNNLLKLQDIAKVSLKPFKETAILRYKGNRAIAIGLIMQSGENILKMSDELYKILPKIKNNIPSDVKIDIAYNGAVPVQDSINKVYTTIFEAILLVGLVVYIFLGSFRLILIPLITIPISLIGTLFLMNIFGFSINTFTLLAMILAIGLVVDDAIVMMENIFRIFNKKFIKEKNIYQGLEVITPAKQAAIYGAKQVGFAIIAMTITLSAVFLPVGFIDGFVGKLFIEFAWTLAFCVLLSGVVALTLTPMMSSTILVQDTSKPQILKKFDSFFNYIQEKYCSLLISFFKNSKIFIIISVISILLIIASFIFVKKEFAPNEDQGMLQIFFNTPEGSNLSYSNNSAKKIESILAKHKDVKGYFIIAQNGGGRAFVPLIPWDDREKSHLDIKQDLNKELTSIPSASIYVNSPRSLQTGSSYQVGFNIQTAIESHNHLKETTDLFIKEMEKADMFININDNFDASNPTLDININKEKANLYNVTLNEIGQTIQYFIAGKEVGDFRIGNNIYQVVMRLPINKRDNIHDVKSIMIKSRDNQMINLESIANIEEKITIKNYFHYNNNKAITINANLASGYTINDAFNKIEEISKNLLKKRNAKIEYTGAIKQMLESNNNLLFAFALAIIFIYLVLSAQFESFKDGILILSAVPFSIIGALIGLLLFGNSLNMYSNIGIITLVGLVTKNSIMIVEFINQLLRDEKFIKLNMQQIIIEATKLRFRPIMMTSIATIIGATPLVFSHGSGAASRISIGITITSGMLIGTLFTLFIIPFICNIFKKDPRRG